MEPKRGEDGEERMRPRARLLPLATVGGGNGGRRSFTLGVAREGKASSMREDLMVGNMI
jgi:hypothetical protein